MTIAAVSTGKFAFSNGFSLTPGGTGHFILLSVVCNSTTNWATGVSNSGNVTWTTLVSHQVLSNGGITATVFLGQVNSTSAQNQTVAFNTGSPGLRIAWQEFSTTAGFSLITLDASGSVDVSSSGVFPSVTPTRASDTYWSFVADSGTGAAGSTSGYTYAVDSIDGDLACYNTSCANATQAPNIGDTADGTSGIGVMMFEATGSVTALPGRAAGTGTALAPSASTGTSVTAFPGRAAGTGTAGGPLASAVRSNAGFPYHQLKAKVELLINGTWTDITAFTYVRDPISISPFGRVNETTTMETSQLSLTLNNRSGRFTAGNSSGAYYPFIQLNTQIRVSVNDTSVNGTAYSGYRFWGEVSTWPVAWDEGGRDVYAQVIASGIWRRLSQSTRLLGSPFTRWNTQLGGSNTIAAYWPMEDGQGSTTMAEVSAAPSGPIIVPTLPAPTLAATSAFPGSDALPQLNGAVLTGNISTSSSPAQVVWRFCLFVPGGGDTGVPTGTVLGRLFVGGTINHVDVSFGSPKAGGPFTITGYNAGGTVLFTGSVNENIWGIPIMMQVGLVKSGSNVIWSCNQIIPGTSAWYGTVTGTLTGATLSDATKMMFNPSGKLVSTTVGQSIVMYSNPSITQDASALQGWTGEYAGARFLRLCAEQGIAATLTGSSTSGTTMGPQIDETLSNTLRVIEDTDGGLLFETRNQFGLGYRTRATLQNQLPALTLNYAAQQLFAPLNPVNDDALVHNDVTVTNYDGYAVRAYLASGARSIQAPPNGVGTGYERTTSASSTDHAQVDALALQVLNSGVVSDNRYPSVTVNLARVTTAGLFAAVPSVNVGDYLALSNLPAYSGATAHKQLVWGWSETINSYAWTFTLNTIPEAPWESGFAPGGVVTGQVPGSPTTAGQAGSVSGAQIAENAITLFSLAQEVLSFKFGGISSVIDSVAPSAPNDGDLWFDSGNGFQIKRWDAGGGSWVPVTFTGSNILGAGTITAGLLAANAVVAGNIAAGSVTANQLAAGIVKAGIVNGTLISGAQFVAYGTTGEILVYASNPPAAGNLIMSVSGLSGTDGQGNAYNAGVWIYDSGGQSVGLVPGGGTAASQLALSIGGSTPTPPAGAAAIYGAGSGAVQGVDATDGQTYSVTSRRSIVPVIDQNVTSTGFNTWASSTITGPSTSARVYRVHGMAFVAPNASGGKIGFQWTAPAGVSGHIDFTYVTATSIANSGALNQGVSTGGVAPTFVLGTEQTVYIDGAFSIPTSTSGTFAMQAAITTSTAIIRAFSFIEIMPV